ncbi:MAG: nitronate monooxygenase [Eubacteriales bacterium]|nr:nitronate monooxygenase [Eubacteriales bacterium]
MQIKNKVLDIPVIQGGMGVGVSLSSLAGAVAASGACGVISSVNAGYAEDDFEINPIKANLKALDYHIKKAKQTAKESGKNGLVAVNIMTAVSHFAESCKIAVSAGADIIISGAGLPLNLPQFTKGTDTLAAPIVSSGRAAKIIMKTYKKHFDVYPDMFIIEGSMAGGHLGFSADDIINGKAQSNDEILSDVLRVTEEEGVRIPVFVAGGVFDGSDMAHYIKKGAAGVQIATRFIATSECDASDTFKQAVVNAKKEDIRIIKSPVGMPARAINSPLLERIDKGERFLAEKCNGCLTACKKDDSIPYCISRALIAAVKGDWDNGLFFAGSNAERVDRIMSVQQLIDEIMTEYRLNKSDIQVAD